jgi:hypothetical protein
MKVTDADRRKTRRPKGAIPQRQLVQMLNVLIDDALAKNSTAHRDIARAKIRELLKPDDRSWQTGFVLNNLSVRRCRYLAGMGLPVPMRFLSTFGRVQKGYDKPEWNE